MVDLLSLGELLIDFTPAGNTDSGIQLFGRNPGGAPANVAVQARRAGVSSGFLGCVGNDMFGLFLKDTLGGCGVDVEGLALDDAYATSLAFVELDENGDRNFSFYRSPGADTRLTASEENKRLIDDCKLLCYGSLLMTAEPAASAVPELVAYARKAGKITAYDPNWRPPLWKDRADGIAAMKRMLPLSDIIKVSDEELLLITEEADTKKAAGMLLKAGISIVIVTLGAKGCRVITAEHDFERPTFDTKIRDTTGAGDSFFGAFLAKVIQSGKKPGELGLDALIQFADFANAAGAVCGTKKGAIPAIPETADIQKCIEETPLLRI